MLCKLILIQSFVFLLSIINPLLAEGRFFGFQAPFCIAGGNYDSKNHICSYCPRGTKPADGSFSENKKCVGTPLLGTLCPFGKRAWFNEEQDLCFYCATGYTVSYDRKSCYK